MNLLHDRSRTNLVSQVHPSAKIALGVLSRAAKVCFLFLLPISHRSSVQIILAEVDRDIAVLGLLEKLCEVYGFITQDQMLGQMSPVILGKISQQTRECAHFIRDYSEIKSFCEYHKLLHSVPSQASTIVTGKRLGKNIFSETADTIQKYSDVFDSFMQNSRDNVTHDVAIHVLHTGKGSDIIVT